MTRPRGSDDWTKDRIVRACARAGKFARRLPKGHPERAWAFAADGPYRWFYLGTIVPPPMTAQEAVRLAVCAAWRCRKASRVRTT